MDTLTGVPVAVNERRPQARYADIDLRAAGRAAAWPPGPLPRLSGKEAIGAARRLWRHAVGRAWPGSWKAGRGNHRSYPRGAVFLVNPGQGWPGLVHDLSHEAYQRLVHGPVTLWVKGERLPVVSAAKLEDYRTVRRSNGNGRIHHSDAHAALERAMIRLVLEQGWLDGRLK